jgi:hypothetical protein
MGFSHLTCLKPRSLRPGPGAGAPRRGEPSGNFTCRDASSARCAKIGPVPRIDAIAGPAKHAARHAERHAGSFAAAGRPFGRYPQEGTHGRLSSGNQKWHHDVLSGNCQYRHTFSNEKVPKRTTAERRLRHPTPATGQYAKAHQLYGGPRLRCRLNLRQPSLRQLKSAPACHPALRRVDPHSRMKSTAAGEFSARCHSGRRHRSARAARAAD